MRLKLAAILTMILLFAGCSANPTAQETAARCYTDVVGFADGFVAVGHAGMASFIDANQEITPLQVDTDADLLCVAQWQDGLVIGGADGILWKMDTDFSTERQRLGRSDIVSIVTFQGKLYAISQNGKLYESADGDDWNSSKTGLQDVVGMAASADCLIASSEDADIFIMTAEGTEQFNYNEKYEGLATGLTVKGVGADPYLVWLLGTYDTGEPAAVHSDLGEFWHDRPLVVLDEGQTMLELDTQPFSLVYTDLTGYRVLICEQGHLLVLTDCQECNQYYETQTDSLTAGAFWDGHLCLVGEDEFVSIED